MFTATIGSQARWTTPGMLHGYRSRAYTRLTNPIPSSCHVIDPLAVPSGSKLCWALARPPADPRTQPCGTPSSLSSMESLWADAMLTSSRLHLLCGLISDLLFFLDVTFITVTSILFFTHCVHHRSQFSFFQTLNLLVPPRVLSLVSLPSSAPLLRRLQDNPSPKQE
jgi:hypothetical protein